MKCAIWDRALYRLAGAEPLRQTVEVCKPDTASPRAVFLVLQVYLPRLVFIKHQVYLHCPCANLCDDSDMRANVQNFYNQIQFVNDIAV